MKTTKSRILAVCLFLVAFHIVEANGAGPDEGCYDNQDYLDCIDQAAETFSVANANAHAAHEAAYNEAQQEYEDCVTQLFSDPESCVLVLLLARREADKALKDALEEAAENYEKALEDCLCHCEEGLGPSCE